MDKGFSKKISIIYMSNLFLGNAPILKGKNNIGGKFVTIDGEKFYQIKNYDKMSPFFISISSNSDLWMYLSSTGSLTAGRKNPDMALFPYYTDDKITESAEITGSKTIFHVKKDGKVYLWEPFSTRNSVVYNTERNILKSVTGNKILFSETNKDLGLTFQYMWMNADKFGWIRRGSLINDTQEDINVVMLDGIQNVLPFGTNRVTQNTYSTLVDAYKKTELVEGSTLALYRMEAIMVDRAEPSESLRVNTVWSIGLNNAKFLLSSAQLDAFRRGEKLQPEVEAKGVRGAYFAYITFTAKAGKTKQWYMVAEVDQDAVKVNSLLEYLKNGRGIEKALLKGVKDGSEALKAIVAEADGIQNLADENKVARHFANTMFNTMRGGIYCNGYTIDTDKFKKHIELFNKKLFAAKSAFLSKLPAQINYVELEKLVKAENDANLYRLFQEYLPLTFGRRHGDPSRPWNIFNIKVTDEKGEKIISYQGNWRDIFQNWEALSLSFPAFINGIIAKFLNATTADGYNPYKLTSEGFDWEVIDPADPWSNIGYWGDHQMIYLLKLMELSQDYYPESLLSLLNQESYAYANVPYRIKTYAEIVADPKNSINFDDETHKRVLGMVPSYGVDAKLILDKNQNVVLATFTEKVLVTFLAKMSNFIPGAGIWMNTLRPEWNDANNALVGYGTSMVTLYYMRRFVNFLAKMYGKSTEKQFHVSAEVAGLLEGIYNTLKANEGSVAKIDDKLRKQIVDALGKAGETYRCSVYKGFSGNKKDISAEDLQAFFAVVVKFIDQSIKENKMKNGMYHAYNTISFSENGIKVSNLYEMLEGQVSVLSSGKLSPKEVVELLDAMRQSALYRADQFSYTLYPNKRLPLFLEKNVIPEKDIKAIKVLDDMIAAGDTDIVTKDVKGLYHFNASFNNAEFLKKAMAKKSNISAADQKAIDELYEKIFNHQAFTGRSGTFYKYEGLGCIYWHMVSKLLLAIGENIKWAVEQGADAATIAKLKKHYADVQFGIGAHKTPAQYGSFPFDAYSHTPTMAGVQQPGMTGQVKEDIINRFFELGLIVKDGALTIQSTMLDKKDFVGGKKLSFTSCSIKFEYVIDGKEGIEIAYAKKTEKVAGYTLSREQSQLIFNRDKSVKQVTVHFKSL